MLTSNLKVEGSKYYLTTTHENAITADLWANEYRTNGWVVTVQGSKALAYKDYSELRSHWSWVVKRAYHNHYGY